MDFFRFRKSAPNVSKDQILAYLEEVQRLHTFCLAVDIKDSEFAANVIAVGEEGFSLLVEGPIVVRRGGILGLRFILDGLRFLAKAEALERIGNELKLSLPHRLELDERRQRPRAVPRQQKVARATLLTGLFEGKAVSGIIENISESGLRLHLSLALSIRRQAPIPLVEDVLVPGENLAVVRIDDLHLCPTLEVAGKVVYCFARTGRISVGVSFDPGQEDKLQPLKDYVGTLTDAIPHVVPRKERRSAGKPTASDPAPPVLERRTFARLAVGSDYALKFRAGGHTFPGLALVDISAGGCSWRVDRLGASAMPLGAPLELLVIEHPDLPVAELSAQVVEVTPEPGGATVVRAEFTDLDPRVRSLFDQHIQRKLAQAPSRPQPKPAEAQAYPSLALPLGHTVSFRHRGAAYPAVAITDISAVRCVLAMPAHEAQAIQPGSLLALFKFDHPDLPTILLQAQVVKVDLSASPQPARLEVEFVSINERVRAAIHTYVLNRIGAQGGEEDAPMSYELPSEEELALHPRVSLGSDHTCSFRMAGVVFQDVPMTNLSDSGCGFRVHIKNSGPFCPGSFVQAFRIHHPEFPAVPMQGCLSQVVGKIPGRTMGFILVHMDFQNLNERLIKIIKDHVGQRLGRKP